MDGEGVKQAGPAPAHEAQPEANGHVYGSVDTPALPLAESSATGSLQGGEVEQQLQLQECMGSVGGSGDSQEPLLEQSAGSGPSLEAASKLSSSSNVTTDEPQEQGSEPHAEVGSPGAPFIAAATSQAGEAEAPSGVPGPSPSAAPSAAPGIAPTTAASEPGVGVPAAPAAAAAAPSLTSASQPQEQLRRSLGAPESSQASLAAATAGGLSNGSSPCMPLSKNGSWSSVLMGDGDAVPDCASPGPASVSGASASGSSSNLAAMAAGVPALGTWKAKLQQNMPPPSQQQQPSRSSGSGGRAPAPGTSPGMLQQGAKASPQGSQGPLAAQQAPVPMRRAGSRTGMYFMLEPAKPSAGKLLCSHDGQFTYAPVGCSGSSGAAAGSASPLQTAPGTLQQQHEGARLLRLARPLLNRGSQNNCFLNVILQSLWHLACFRQSMLELQLEQHAASKGASPEDQRVMAAIWRIFQAMAQSPTAQEPAQGACDVGRIFLINLYYLCIAESRLLCHTSSSSVMTQLMPVHQGVIVF